MAVLPLIGISDILEEIPSQWACVGADAEACPALAEGFAPARAKPSGAGLAGSPVFVFLESPQWRGAQCLALVGKLLKLHGYSP
jgi:hypothetical protein